MKPVFMITTLFLSSLACGEIMYELIDLGDLSGGNSCARAINNLGQVVGYNEVEGNRHAFYWDSTDGMIDLGTFEGYASAAWDINDERTVVGHYTSPNGSSYYDHPFIWTEPDGMTGIQYPYPYTDLGYRKGQALGINNQGQIVGYGGQGGDTYPFIYENGQYTALDHFTYMQSGAYAINEEGRIAGFSRIDVEHLNHTSSEFSGILWDINGDMTIMRPFLAGSTNLAESFAYDINNQGRVVGTNLSLRTNYDLRTFIWDETNGLIELDAFEDYFSSAVAINESDQVVGYYGQIYDQYYLPEIAFIWDEINGAVDLNTLIDPLTGWTLVSAYDINDYGQIVGMGIFNGQERAYLLNPTPEPSSFLLLGMGAFVLTRRRKKHI
ncbi:MAG: DUF3466 family protein [Sedimentisphaerales bacterium]|nr:DUF3466 family protein [Sedimentisphaerales bacterium]